MTSSDLDVEGSRAFDFLCANRLHGLLPYWIDAFKCHEAVAQVRMIFKIWFDCKFFLLMASMLEVYLCFYWRWSDLILNILLPKIFAISHFCFGVLFEFHSNWYDGIFSKCAGKFGSSDRFVQHCSGVLLFFSQLYDLFRLCMIRHNPCKVFCTQHLVYLLQEWDLWGGLAMIWA